MKLLGNHECLRKGKGGPVVNFQGDIDLPVFASGDGAEFVDYFRSGNARREMNLQTSVDVTAATEKRFPSIRHQIGHAALLVSLVQLFRGYEDILGMTVRRKRWADTAKTVLEDLAPLAMATEGAEDLWPIRCELLVRLYELENDPAEAVRVLQQVEPSVLTRRNLARRLIDATSSAINQQSTSTLEKTEEKLLLLRKLDAATAAAAEQKFDLLKRAERERRAESYSLVAPRGTFPDPVSPN